MILFSSISQINILPKTIVIGKAFMFCIIFVKTIATITGNMMNAPNSLVLGIIISIPPITSATKVLNSLTHAFSSALISNFFIFKYTSITFLAFAGSLKSLGRTVGTICQETPNLSFSQPQWLS